MSQGPFLPYLRPSIDQAAIDEVVACLRSGWITTGERRCVVTRDAKRRRDVELLRFHGIDRDATPECARRGLPHYAIALAGTSST